MKTRGAGAISAVCPIAADVDSVDADLNGCDVYPTGARQGSTQFFPRMGLEGFEPPTKRL